MTFKTSFVQPLTEVSASQKEVLGTIRVENAGKKIYKYCELKNSATVAGVAGDQLVYFAVTGYGVSRVCVRAADGDAVPIPAGILTASCAGVGATSYFLWVQIKGAATLSTAVASAAAGKRFTASTTNVTFTVMADDFSPEAGISLSTTTSVYLNCPF